MKVGLADRRFVAGFIGSPAMNFLSIYTQAGNGGRTITVAGGDAVAVPTLDAHGDAGPLTLGVRPEDLTPVTDGPALVRGTVDVLENLGEQVIVYLDTGSTAPIIVKLPRGSSVSRGQPLALIAPMDRMHLFGHAGRNLFGRLH